MSASEGTSAEIREGVRDPVRAPGFLGAVAISLGGRVDGEAQKARPFTVWVAGVVAPASLFWFDRGLGGVGSDGVIPFRPYFVLMAAAAVTTLVAWTWLHGRSSAAGSGRWMHAVLAGPLLVCGAAAAALGLAILPFSIVGTLLAGVGLLGLLPFWTAFALLRAGAISWRAGRSALASGPARALALLAAMVVCMGVVGAGRLARLAEARETAILVGERRGSTRLAELSLRALWLFPQVPLTQLRENALTEPTGGFGPLRQAYERITGLPLEPDSD